MALRKIIKDTVKELRRNTWLIFLFSLMFIVSMLALLLAPTPTYVSLGGSFMRVGSIPEMTPLDIAIVITAYLISLFIFADAITNINLIIKSNRTLNRIPADVFKGISKYALKLLLIYTMAVLLSFAVNIATFDSPYHNIIYPLFTLLIFLAIFFVPPAIIVDDMDTTSALSNSIGMLASKWKLVLVWMVSGLVAISLIELISFAIFPLGFAKYLVMALNGLLIIPVLTIFQTQLYLEKYPLSP